VRQRAGVFASNLIYLFNASRSVLDKRHFSEKAVRTKPLVRRTLRVG